LDLAHALRDGDHRRNDDDQEQHQQHKHHWIDLPIRHAPKAQCLPRLRKAAGRRATMPMVMISDIPLPIPRSVI
jgi:hypothetical protein